MIKDYSNIKIAIILGTRAELIKCMPIMRELTIRKVPFYFIHTGQHNFEDLCEKFRIKKPDIILTKEPTKGSKFNSNQIKAIIWNIGLIPKIKRELKKLPNLKHFIYHGDTMTATTAAIASFKVFNPFKKYKKVHLEAGLRSWNIFEPFTEELSRRFLDRFSDTLLVVSEMSEDNVNKYKKKEIILAGNTVLDSADISLKIAKEEKIKPLSSERFALITVHRHENLKSKKRMEKIIQILSEIPIDAYFAVHDNTLKKLEEFDLLNKLKANKKIHIIKPLDYVSFIYQMSKCSLIICDGGSMQEESLIFKKPCILLRMATERQEGLETNFQYLSKLDLQKTKEKIKEYLNPNFKIKQFKNPYGEKGLSKKIVDLLLR